MNHFDDFKREMEAACWRITGKTVDEWDTVFADRRSHGFRKGELSHDRVMTEWEAERIRSKYGLRENDIERILIKPYMHNVPLSSCFYGDDGKPILTVVFCDDHEIWNRIRSKRGESFQAASGKEIQIAIAYRVVADLNNRRFE